MGKYSLRELMRNCNRCGGKSDRQQEAGRSWRRLCMHAQKPSNWFWQPAVPSWEKEFCFKVGLFPWEEFVSAKKHVHRSRKVMEWNDSAAEEAFRSAKQRFWAEKNGLPCLDSMPSPDMYIDEIEWSCEEESELLATLGVPGADAEEDDAGVQDCKLTTLELPIDAIKPTGWDMVYTDDMAKNGLLCGLVVGDGNGFSLVYRRGNDDSCLG